MYSIRFALVYGSTTNSMAEEVQFAPIIPPSAPLPHNAQDTTTEHLCQAEARVHALLDGIIHGQVDGEHAAALQRRAEVSLRLAQRTDPAQQVITLPFRILPLVSDC